MLSETGFVLGLQTDLVNAISRQIAEKKSGKYERLFRIGQVYKHATS